MRDIIGNSICVLIPGRIDKPVGGHKVIYQYVNYMAALGWKIIIANVIYLPSNANPLVEFLRRIHAALRCCSRFVFKQNTCRSWFHLDQRIHERMVWSCSKTHVPQTDYYIATDALTTSSLADYDVPAICKLYFIQGYENWRLTDEQLRATYHIPAKRIVVSSWLNRIMDEENVSCTLIQNGIDLKEFSLTIPIREKDPCLISMIYHTDNFKSIKNTQLGFEALQIVRKKIPNLRVLLFGVFDKPKDLPSWYTYYQCPDIDTHRLINNQASIFIGTSNEEGYGLPVLEAMACGQAVACTDNKGYMEIARHGYNALLSPIRDSQALAQNVISLIMDESFRISLAHNGYQTAQELSLEKSCEKFVDCLCSRL